MSDFDEILKTIYFAIIKCLTRARKSLKHNLKTWTKRCSRPTTQMTTSINLTKKRCATRSSPTLRTTSSLTTLTKTQWTKSKV